LVDLDKVLAKVHQRVPEGVGVVGGELLAEDGSLLALLACPFHVEVGLVENVEGLSKGV
jgi:hypothetical protein